MVHAEDGEVVHLSRAWLQLTGYPREEIDTIASWTDRAYGDRQKGVRADIDRLYALDQAVDEGEELIRCADGRTRVWTFSRSASLGGDDCGRRLVVTMAADVTERKEAEQALRDSELRMRALLDASQDEILLLSTAGEILAINKAAERRLAKRTEGTDPVGVRLDRLVPTNRRTRGWRLSGRWPRRRHSCTATHRSGHAGSSSGSIRCCNPTGRSPRSPSMRGKDHPAEEIAGRSRQAVSSDLAEPDIGRHHRPGR